MDAVDSFAVVDPKLLSKTDFLWQWTLGISERKNSKITTRCPGTVFHRRTIDLQAMCRASAPVLGFSGRSHLDVNLIDLYRVRSCRCCLILSLSVCFSSAS